MHMSRAQLSCRSSYVPFRIHSVQSQFRFASTVLFLKGYKYNVVLITGFDKHISAHFLIKRIRGTV
jgi:hypothetical protein